MNSLHFSNRREVRMRRQIEDAMQRVGYGANMMYLLGILYSDIAGWLVSEPTTEHIEHHLKWRINLATKSTLCPSEREYLIRECSEAVIDCLDENTWLSRWERLIRRINLVMAIYGQNESVMQKLGMTYPKF